MTTPTQGVAVKRDRAVPGSRHNRPTKTIAFVVHYAVESVPGSHLRSEEMWEYEAVEFANKIAGWPGMKLLETPDRPRGIESIQGWDDVSKSSVPDNTVGYLLAKARRLALAARDALAEGDGVTACEYLADLSAYVACQPVETTREKMSNVVTEILGGRA